MASCARDTRKRTNIFAGALLSMSLLESDLNYGSELTASATKLIGTPYSEDFDSAAGLYARNVWDLQFFCGLLFIGAGNSSNGGPAPNAGPIQLRYFNPETNEFHEEGIAREEQIERFRVVGKKLYIPGHDPTARWTLGNFYERLEKGYWLKYRNIPGAIHTYDIAGYKGKLYAALGIKGGAAVGVSSDNGRSWRVEPIKSSRGYGFLSLGENLYVSKKIKRRAYNIEHEYSGIWELTPTNTFMPRPDLYDQVLFPGAEFTTTWSKKIVRSEPVDDKVIYIGGYIHNDHQSKPFGAYVASSLEHNNTSVIPVPAEAGYVPWDILVREDYAYLLYSQRNREGRGFNIVVKRASVQSLSDWSNYISFSAPTLARSFEENRGDFYFGLGTEIASSSRWSLEELHSSSGQILLLRAEDIERMQ